MSQKGSLKGNLKQHMKFNEDKNITTKFVGHSQCSVNRKIHSTKWIYYKREQVSNQESKLLFQKPRKRRDGEQVGGRNKR